MLESKLLNTQPMLTNKLDTCLETVEEVMWLGLVTTIPSSLITRQPPVPAPQLSAHGTPLETPPRTILISWMELWWEVPAMNGTPMWMTGPTTSPMRSLWTTMQDSKELLLDWKALLVVQALEPHNLLDLLIQVIFKPFSSIWYYLTFSQQWQRSLKLQPPKRSQLLLLNQSQDQQQQKVQQNVLLKDITMAKY